MNREWRERASVRMGWAIFVFAVCAVAYVAMVAGFNIILIGLGLRA